MKLSKMLKMKAKKQTVIDSGVDELIARLSHLGYITEKNKSKVIKEIEKSLHYFDNNELVK